MKSRLREALLCILIGSVIGLVVALILFIRVLAQTVAEVPLIVQAEVAQTRAAALAAISDSRRDMMAEIDSIRTDARELGDGALGRIDAATMTSRRQISELTAVADKRIGETIALVSETIRPVPALLAGLNETNRTIRETVASIRPTIDHTNEATAILFRRDALPAQILGLVGASKVTMGETAQTMRDIQRATPQMLLTFGTFERSAAATAENLNRLTKPRWYDRAIGYGMTGAVTYRALHPVTNVTLKGTEYLSPKP